MDRYSDFRKKEKQRIGKNATKRRKFKYSRPKVPDISLIYRTHTYSYFIFSVYRMTMISVDNLSTVLVKENNSNVNGALVSRRIQRFASPSQNSQFERANCGKYLT